MNYSISTHCMHSTPLDAVLDTFAPHTDHVEIMDDGPHFLADAELLLSYSYKYSIHAPSRGVNLASVLEPIRRAAVEVIHDTLSIAAEIGASVVIHPGYAAWEYDRDQAKKSLRASLAQIRSDAAEFGVTYFIENMGNWGYFYLQTPAEIELLDGALFCLDIGHANECGNLNEFLKVPFSHVHLHDNDGKHDSHSAVGDGTIDFERVMAKVKENKVTLPVIEVETLNGALKSLALLKERGYT
ncbi:MAG TPA: sugar phosphate isomerase/epimerase family protein [Methanocorpusculum sp.]|nr:sugar phosphate isomerase/epimerase [Methanocorpusculum sp.]HJJ50150.1 sugar phosphate isomerase/epimerase [Methanocorpusculum sp.]HKL97858.1 sugar phosphate isomerase/epimerase family protein [Methanocorpusculum sp.]